MHIYYYSIVPTTVYTGILLSNAASAKSCLGRSERHVPSQRKDNGRQDDKRRCLNDEDPVLGTCWGVSIYVGSNQLAARARIDEGAVIAPRVWTQTSLVLRCFNRDTEVQAVPLALLAVPPWRFKTRFTTPRQPRVPRARTSRTTRFQITFTKT